MNNLILPIFSTVVLVSVGLFFYMVLMKVKKTEEKKMKEEDKGSTAQGFTNVKDIDAGDSILYTADGLMMSYIEIEPVSLALMTETEKRSYAERLTLSLSRHSDPWKFLAISRPVDTKPLIDDYKMMYDETDNDTRKKLLRHSIRMMEQYALSDDVTKRQFYFVIWDKYKDDLSVKNFIKKRESFITAIKESGTKIRLAGKVEMIKLLNLYFNPAVINYEDYDDENLKLYMEMR